LTVNYGYYNEQQKFLLMSISTKNNKVYSVFVLLLFFFLAVSSGESPTDEKQQKTPSYMEDADSTQLAFARIEKDFDSRFKNSKNDLQLNAISDAKNDSLKTFFGNYSKSGLVVNNWRGSISEIMSLPFGGGLKVACNLSGVRFYLSSKNENDEIYSKSIKKNTELYNLVMSLTEGDQIQFNGKFFKAPRYLNRDVLCNSDFVNEDQEYVFLFTEITKLD
jgi:hypothetical protein